MSWYQETLAFSLDLIASLDLSDDESIIDIGGGASTLVDHLYRIGHRDLTVLDISAVALDTARNRFGNPDGVTWIHQDLLTWDPSRRWRLWHDRAVLHFLTAERDQAEYMNLLRRALEPGGVFVIGVFAEDGPTHCSNLPVRRFSANDLSSVLGDFDLIEYRREVHHTPGGAVQPFTWISGRLPRE